MMGHEIDTLLFIATIIYTLAMGSIFVIIAYQRLSRKVKAMDYLLLYFGLIFLAGVSQILKPIYHERVWILGLYKGIQHPLGFNPVRNFGLLASLVLFVFAEHILNERLNTIRVSVIITSLIIYIFSTLYYLNTGSLIHTNSVIFFAQSTRIDEFANDIIWYLAYGSILVAFYKQFKNSRHDQYKKNLKLITIAILLFFIPFHYEVVEHFFPVPDIDLVFFTIPTVLVLSFIYIRDPYFVYYSPVDVQFLQIGTTSGKLLYAIEYEQLSESESYLLNMGLTSLNSMLTELVSPNYNDELAVETIEFDEGAIVFEQKNNIVIVLHTSRKSLILRRAMRQILREFIEEYGNQAMRFEERNFVEKAINPLDLIHRYIPSLTEEVKVESIDTKESQFEPAPTPEDR